MDHMNSCFRTRPVLWFTGLSGAGKTTLAEALKIRIDSLQAPPAIVLDGDVLRRGLTANLGFSLADRAESVRRTAEVAKILRDAGHIVIVALISPLAAHRETARRVLGAGYKEIYVATDFAACQARDPKGLYARATRGQLQEFTGVDSIYEPPLTPDLRIDTASTPLEACIDELVRLFLLDSTRGVST